MFLICRLLSKYECLMPGVWILETDVSQSVVASARIDCENPADGLKRVATCPARSTVWLLFWLMQDFRLPFIVRRWVYLEGGG